MDHGWHILLIFFLLFLKIIYIFTQTSIALPNHYILRIKWHTFIKYSKKTKNLRGSTINVISTYIKHTNIQQSIEVEEL